MPNWHQVHNSLILVGEIVFLKGHVMVIDLIVVDMPNFDTILDIDFLSKYGAKYRKKKVRFSMNDAK